MGHQINVAHEHAMLEAASDERLTWRVYGRTRSYKLDGAWPGTALTAQLARLARRGYLDHHDDHGVSLTTLGAQRLADHHAGAL